MVSVDIESLLLQAELIKKKDLDHAITLSKKKNFPLAEVLVSAGYIRDQTLDVALAAQTFVRNKILTIEIAVRALKEGEQRNLSLDQVLLEYGLNSKLLICTNMLGQLMVDSAFITEKQWFEALQIALSSNLPFCRVLVVQRVINNIQAYAVLSAAMLIRRGEVLREHAITALKLTKLTNCPLEVALKERGFLDSQIFGKVMLGELLMISNQLSEGLFLASLEQNFIEGLPLGKILVDSGCISQDRLDRVLYAQRQISDGQISQMFHADFVRDYAVSFSSIS